MNDAPLRIWFNRTYATNAHVIAQLRDNPDRRPVHVLASHTDPDSPVLFAADEAALEPPLAGSAYVEWALEFVRAHRVEIVFARYALADLVDARVEFARLGATLAAPDAATVRLFADKAAGYRAARALELPVAPFELVTTADELSAAHARLSPLGPLCVKPNTGAGGEGFRRITTGPPELSEYLGRPRHRADLARLVEAMRRAEQAGATGPTLVLMPVLPGPEISVDTVADRAGRTLAAIGRTHADPPGRRRRVVDDRAARRVAETLNRAHAVSYLANTQVSYWQGPSDPAPRPYLLELNTRISGGLYQTARAGVNLPWTAVRIARNEPTEALRPTYGRAFTQLPGLIALPDDPPGPVREPRGEGHTLGN